MRAKGMRSSAALHIQRMRRATNPRESLTSLPEWGGARARRGALAADFARVVWRAAMRSPGSVSILALLCLIGCGTTSTSPDGGGGGAAGGGVGGGAGGGGGSANRVTGSINGQALAVQSASAQRFTAVVVTTDHQGLVIRLSEHASLCSPTGPVGYGGTNQRMLTLRIDNAPDAGPVTAGQYTARLAVEVPDCASSANGYNYLTLIDGADVSVNLTNVTGRVQGSFTGTVSSGAPVSGTFDTEYCSFYDWERTSLVHCN